MKTSHVMFESLESRQMLSAAPLEVAHADRVHPAGNPTVIRHHLASAVKPAQPSAPVTTDYSGTATNQNDNTSQITASVTQTGNKRTGIININNRNGIMPIAISITPALTFSFSFAQTGEKDHVVGKLSANGKTITGSWISDQAGGKVGHGTFVLTSTGNAAT